MSRNRRVLLVAASLLVGHFGLAAAGTATGRANQVLDNVGADASAHGNDQAYVRTIFTDQIAATEGIEYTRFGQWKFDPTTAPGTAPTRPAVYAGAVVGDQVLLPAHLSRRDIRRSASTLPPVWQVGQY